jgi:hypothetical protein
MLTSALMTTGGSGSEARKGDESFFFDFLSALVRLKRMVGMVGAEMLLLEGLGLLLIKFLRNCVHFESGGALLKNSVIFSCFRSDSLDGSITEFLSLTNLRV